MGRRGPHAASAESNRRIRHPQAARTNVTFCPAASAESNRRIRHAPSRLSLSLIGSGRQALNQTAESDTPSAAKGWRPAGRAASAESNRRIRHQRTHGTSSRRGRRQALNQTAESDTRYPPGARGSVRAARQALNQTAESDTCCMCRFPQ